MNKLTFNTIKANNWDIVYLSFADKLYITDKIRRNSVPHLIDNNIIFYITNEKSLSGVVVENLKRSFDKGYELNKVISYIEERSEQDSVDIPLEEEFISPILNLVNNNLSH